MDGNKVTFTISKGLLWVISTTMAGAGSGVAIMNSNPPTVASIAEVQLKFFEKRLDRIENKLDKMLDEFGHRRSRDR